MNVSVLVVSLRAFVFAALAAASVLPCQAQSVQSVIVHKTIEYLQTSPTNVQFNPQPLGPLYGGPFGFSVEVDGVNMRALPAPTVAGPFNLPALGSFFNNGVLVYNAGDGGWRLGAPNGNGWGSPTLADLESKFGNGTYTVTVAGTPIPLSLAGAAYPNPVVLTLSGGAWVNEKYMIDADKPLTITTNAFAGYTSQVEGQIAIEVDGNLVASKRASQVAGNTLTFVVPTSTLATLVGAAGTIRVGATFAAVTDVRSVATLLGSTNAALYSVNTRAEIVVSAPVFPMVVSGTVTPTVANISAAIKYRPQDVGTTGSVYVFALAPSNMVTGTATTEPLAFAKDGSIQCVLAQLNAAGQLTAASAASLQAYLSGVLGSQGASISVLNNVSTALIQGAVFYVGYGATSTAMINNGINRSVVTIPGANTCKPQSPEAGWWWNKNESGRGFSIETQGNRLFMAGYLYDPSGRATWVVSAGLTSLDGSFYFGDMLTFSGGQTLTGAYKAPGAPTTPGQVTLAFTTATTGTLVWPGGSIAIERFPIAPPTDAAKYAFVPENGWWWSASESGRGYFMEFANNSAFIAGYMYDTAGNPLWYAAGTAAMPNATTFQAPWLQFANGQTLLGPYRAPTLANPNVGTLGIQFQTAKSATLTLPNGRQIPVVRFLF